MMKSFFKKLAFVMALAMVVSLAAPAGQTAFAADAFALTEKNGETKDTYTLAKVGDTLDLDFLNPTEGWNVRGNANYGWDWVSSAPAIADVDWTGLVTAYAEGEAVITGSTNGGDLATVKVIVGEVTVEEPEVNNAYTVTQVSDIELKITFADEDYVATTAFVDVTRYYGEDAFYTEFLETCSANKNVITIKPYVPFEDGDLFIIKAYEGDEGTTFTAEIGDIDEIEITYKSKGKSGVAYAGDPDNGLYIPVELNCKLLSNGVDVTEAERHADAYVEFELVNGDAEGIILDYDGEGNPYLNFDRQGLVAYVKATCYFYDEAGEAKEYTEMLEIEADRSPAYTFKNKVVKWAIVKEDTALSDVNWSTKDIAVDDELLGNGYFVLAVVEDAFGTQYYTDARYSDDNIKAIGYGDSYGYEVRFTSTNPNQIIIGTSGEITTIDATTKAYAFLSLYKDGEKVKNMSVLPMVVKAKRYINKIELDPTQLAIITAGNFTTETLKVTLKDQYGNTWIDVNEGTTAVTMLATADYINNGVTLATPYTNSSKKAEFTVDAAVIKNDITAADKVLSTVTYEVKAGEKKQTVKITLKAPQMSNNQIYANKLLMEANGVDVKLDGSENSTTKKATVKLYTMTNGEKYQYANIKYFTGKRYTEVTSADVVTGDKFLVVTGKDNAVVDMTKVATGHFELVVAEAVDGVMTYGDLVSYSAIVYQATVNEETGKVTARPVSGMSKTFTVSDSTAAVTLKKQDKTHVNQFSETDVDSSLEDIVKAAFTFKFGDSDVKEDAGCFDVVEVRGKYDESSEVLFIKEVDLLIPLDNNNSTVTRKVTVKVGYSVQGVAAASTAGLK